MLNVAIATFHCESRLWQEMGLPPEKVLYKHCVCVLWQFIQYGNKLVYNFKLIFLSFSTFLVNTAQKLRIISIGLTGNLVKNWKKLKQRWCSINIHTLGGGGACLLHAAPDLMYCIAEISVHANFHLIFTFSYYARATRPCPWFSLVLWASIMGLMLTGLWVCIFYGLSDLRRVPSGLWFSHNYTIDYLINYIFIT